MKRILVYLLLVMLMYPTVVYGHSGGTDSDGGHHDYSNVSGLGAYHFHHGYGPHLHTDGLCPFEIAQAPGNAVSAAPPDIDYQAIESGIDRSNEQAAIAARLEAENDAIRSKQRANLLMYGIAFTLMLLSFGAIVFFAKRAG